jgi:hypothetical protein
MSLGNQRLLVQSTFHQFHVELVICHADILGAIAHLCQYRI